MLNISLMPIKISTLYNKSKQLFIESLYYLFCIIIREPQIDNLYTLNLLIKG